MAACARVIALALALAALPAFASAAAALAVDALTGVHAPGHALRDDGRPARDVALPFVRSPGAPGVARRINAAVYLSQLQMPPAAAPHGRFPLADDFPPDEELTFDVVRNDGRVLTLALTSEYCIGHCIDETTTLHFDARTGRRIMLADLLSAEGEATARRRMADDGVAAFEGGLARLPPLPREPGDDESRPAPKPSPVIVDPIDLSQDPGGQEHRDYFESCRDNWEADRDLAPDASHEPNFDIADDGTLVLTQPRCGSGSWRMRLLSDVAPGDLHLAGAALDRLVSPYGRALMRGGPPAPPAGRLSGHVLVGTVGGEAATLMFDEVGCGVSWYGEHERRIMTLGTQDCGETLTLASGTRASVLTLRRDGDRLVGTWRDGAHALPAIFAP